MEFINRKEPREVSALIDNLTSDSTTFDIVKDDNIVGEFEAYKISTTFYLLHFKIDQCFRGEGIGRETIANIFKLDDVYKISGDCIPDSYEFWKRMNADLEFDDELDDINDYLESGETIPFIIYKEDFEGGM